MKPHLVIKDFLQAAAYRIPQPITEIRSHSGLDFAVCPHCKSILPADFVRYCDRCGQRLDWKNF